MGRKEEKKITQRNVNATQRNATQTQRNTTQHNISNVTQTQHKRETQSEEEEIFFYVNLNKSKLKIKKKKRKKHFFSEIPLKKKHKFGDVRSANVLQQDDQSSYNNFLKKNFKGSNSSITST